MFQPLPPTPLFVGPVEILLVGAVAIVILFGPRAPEIARRIGESFGEFQKSKKKVEQEVDEVTEEFDEVREEVENVRDEVDVTDDLKSIQTDFEPGSDIDAADPGKQDPRDD